MFHRVASAFWPALALLTSLTLLGCSGGEPAAPAAPTATPPPSTGDPKADAQAIFGSICITCHGPGGKGDGPGAAALDPKPRNFTDPEWQASVTDEHIETIIQYGGLAVGKSPAMPPNPILIGKTEILAELRKHVRSLSAKASETSEGSEDK